MKRTDIEQMLIDFQTVAGTHGYPDLVGKIKDLLDNCPDEIRIEADNLYHRHKYKNISFSQSTTFCDNCYAGVVSYCDRMTIVLFEALRPLFIRQQIQISYAQMSRLSGLSERSVRRAVKELIDKKILYLIQPSTGPDPAIYRVNSCILRSGKYALQDSDKDDLEQAFGCVTTEDVSVCSSPDKPLQWARLSSFSDTNTNLFRGGEIYGKGIDD